VNADCTKLTIYFGERDRCQDRFLADALLDVFGRHRLQASVLLRGAEGFGINQQLRTQRLLTPSEDLPVVGVAVDTRERIAAVVPEITPLVGDGLVSLERARMVTEPAPIDVSRLTDGPHETKLTVYCGRAQRANGRPAFVEIVELLRRHGVAGASVFLGVDGTVAGARQRARFFARNANVPLMIISVGSGEAVARAANELCRLLERPLMTLERVRVCKRDGELLAEPRHPPAQDAAGLPVWQKLMVYAGEYAKTDGRPLYVELIRRLREAGAPGATALRGIWGYHGDHAPHGDRLLSLQRHVPMLTVVVDTPANAGRWFEIVDELTRETGLVTSELVPAAQTTGPGVQLGTLRPA
jgi:PII-like signaling protein